MIVRLGRMGSGVCCPMSSAPLGNLSPTAQTALADRLGVLHALREQALSDIVSLSKSQDQSVPAFQARYESLADEVAKLGDRLNTMPDTEIEGWRGSADSVERGLRTLLGETTRRRDIVEERLSGRGLVWGLGAFAVVAAVGGFVWWRSKR